MLKDFIDLSILEDTQPGFFSQSALTALIKGLPVERPSACNIFHEQEGICDKHSLYSVLKTSSTVS